MAITRLRPCSVPPRSHQGTDQQKPDSHPRETPRKHDHYDPEFSLRP